MKVKVKRKNDEVVKEIESNLLGDYLATGKWEKVDEKKEEKRDKKPTFATSSVSE